MSLSSCNRSLLLLPCLLLAACANDHGPAEEQTNVMEAGKAYSLSVDASKEGSATRALSFDATDKSLSASWARGEKVYVCDRGDISFDGFIQPLQEGAVARLNGSISPSRTLSLPIDLYLLFPRKEWSYTGQEGTLPGIAANFDYASAPVSLYELKESTVGSAQSASFSAQQAVVKLSLHDASGSPLSASSLRVSARGLVQSVSVSHSGSSSTYTPDDATGDITITPDAATDVIWAALRGIDSAPLVSLTANVGGVTYVYHKNTPTTFDQGKPYVITVKMKPLTEGISLESVTSDYIGCVVGQNGRVYTTTAKAAAAATTAVAMIAYVGTAFSGIHGLAIALADEQGAMNQSAAREAAVGKSPVANRNWRLPTLKDWQYMLIGCGNGASYSLSPGEVDCSALNSKLATVGTAINNDGSRYWTSNANLSILLFTKATVDLSQSAPFDVSRYFVRAVLPF